MPGGDGGQYNIENPQRLCAHRNRGKGDRYRNIWSLGLWS